MIPGIIGKKIGMTKIFDKDGNIVPVTVIEAGPCVITQIRTADNDKYTAVQIGFVQVKAEKLTKPLAGHFKKQGTDCYRIVREFRTDSTEGHKVGDELKIGDIFKEETKIKVRGTSKGAGFAGAMKRHGFSGSSKSHGAEKVHRRPMSAGATDAARVFKGKRGPGHMGDATVTIRNLTVVKIDGERNLIAVKGAVPGKKNSTVILENIN